MMVKWSTYLLASKQVQQNRRIAAIINFVNP
jgi:hypothetical protein